MASEARDMPRLHSGWVLLVGLAVILLGYFHTLPGLVNTWLSSPDFSHGLLIPLIVAYIVWDTRDRLFNEPFSPSWLGVVVLIGAQFLLVVAVMADLEKVKAYSLVATILALVLAVGGKTMTRRCGFPLLLLLFAIPLPYLLSKLLTLRLQLISSDLGVAFIRMMSMPVLQEGNLIDFGTFKILVAEACAGLPYMFSLISIALMLAYFMRVPLWAKLAVVIAAIPITIIMNSLRIAATGLIIDQFGKAAAEGFLHLFEGWVVFMAAMVVLLICIWGINRAWPGRRRFIDLFEFSGASQQTHFKAWRYPPVQVVLFYMVLAAGIGTAAWAHLTFEPVQPERERFDRLPLMVDGRGLHRGALEQEVLAVLKPDDHFLGDYIAPSQLPVNLYMAYYAAQRDGAAVHSPKDCLPAGGWTIESQNAVALPGVGGAGNRAIIRKGNERLLVYYWVNQQGRNYAGELMARAALLKDSIIRGRTDAGLIRVIVPIQESVETSEAALLEFIESLAKELPRFLPA